MRFKRSGKIFLFIIILLINSFSAVADGFDFDKAKESVFIVLSKEKNGISIGSGFAIEENLILTNAHVVTDENETYIGTYSEVEDKFREIGKAEIVSIDRNIDIVILKINGASFSPLIFADVETIKEGNDVYAIGAPENLPYTLTKGTVSSKLRKVNDINYIQTDAAINPGNSGGPLLNKEGQLIGMNTMKLKQGENLGFAIRVDSLNEYISSYKENICSDSNENNNADLNKEKSISSNNSSQNNDLDSYYDKGSSIGLLAVLAFIIGFIGILLVISFVVMGKHKTDDDFLILEIDNFAFEQQKDDSKTILNGIQILTGNMEGQQFELEDGKTYTVGKDANVANILLDTSYNMLSRVHCTITYSAKFDKYFVIDCSSNGTYYENGTRLAKNTRTPIARGTVLKLADDTCKILLR